MKRPLAVELFCGRFGWSRGLTAAGFQCIGFDIAHEPYHGKVPEHCELVLQDVLTLHGSQFKDARVIVASPPCQKYSYLAMPWSRSKPVKCEACGGKGKFPVIAASLGLNEIPCVKCSGAGEINHSKKAKELRRKWETEGPDNRLFDACFRIQREAIEATRTDCRECGVARCLTEIQRCESQLMAGEYPAEMEGLLLGLHDWTRELRLLRAVGCSNCNGEGSTTRHIPLIVENVRGAIPWVGPSKANYGSFYLFGDVEMVGNRIFVADEWKHGGAGLRVPARGNKGTKPVPNRGWTQGCAITLGLESYNGHKVPGFRFDGSGRSFQTASVVKSGIKGIKTDRETLPDGTGGTSWFGAGKRGDPRDVKRDESGAYEMPDGTKIGGDWFSDPNSTCRKHGSRSNARKAASAMIAEIPLKLAAFIGWSYYPKDSRPGVCIYPETLDFQQFWCNLEEEKFVRLTPSPIEDGGKLVGKDLGNPILPVPRLKFNPEGQPEECVL